MLFVIDYISVINIKQAPRFAIYKISSESSIYYDTPFYDVIRCNKDTKNEYYKILKNKKMRKQEKIRENKRINEYKKEYT